MQVVMTRGIAARMNRDSEFTEFIEQSLRRYFNKDRVILAKKIGK